MALLHALEPDGLSQRRIRGNLYRIQRRGRWHRTGDRHSSGSSRNHRPRHVHGNLDRYEVGRKGTGIAMWQREILALSWPYEVIVGVCASLLLSAAFLLAFV